MTSLKIQEAQTYVTISDKHKFKTMDKFLVFTL